MKRIFIAVKVVPGENLLKMISSLKIGLSEENIKWTNPENIHITLSFLGDTEEKRIKTINTMLKEKCQGFGRFELVIRSTGIFKSWNDPRIIWTGIDSSEKLLKLSNRIALGLNNIGIKIEERPFKPHLTMGRIKTLMDKTSLKELLEGFKNLEIQKVPVNEVILYESILFHSGPVYKPISKFTLE